MVVAAAILGVVLGYLLGLAVVRATKPEPIGYLRLDHSIPDEPPFLFLELQTTPDSIATQKEVILKVKREDFLSHD